MVGKTHGTRKSSHQKASRTSNNDTAKTGNVSCDKTDNRANARVNSGGNKRETNAGGVSAKPKCRTILEDDEDLNSGFGGYLSSGTGEMTRSSFQTNH